MTPEKIISIVGRYADQLKETGIPKQRMDPKRTFRDLTREELLAHAHFLSDEVQELVQQPELYGKANRHLASVQLCLSFAGWYTLQDLMDHNRP